MHPYPNVVFEDYIPSARPYSLHKQYFTDKGSISNKNYDRKNKLLL